MKIETTWSELKRLADSKVIPLQWVEESDRYHIILVDNGFSLYTVLDKNDATEFETSYKTAANKPIASKTAALPNPEDYRFRAMSTAWTACPYGYTTIDITPSGNEDRFVDGGYLIHKDANPGDIVSFHVAHPTYGIVETYVNSWLVAPGTGNEEIRVYPARIPAGMILRVIYKNDVQGSTAYCGINYRLHKRST